MKRKYIQPIMRSKATLKPARPIATSNRGLTISSSDNLTLGGKNRFYDEDEEDDLW